MRVFTSSPLTWEGDSSPDPRYKQRGARLAAARTFEILCFLKPFCYPWDEFG